jgi:hypothetical protein
MSRPSRSAAAASDARGAVTRRAAHTDTTTMMIAISAMDTMNWRE